MRPKPSDTSDSGPLPRLTRTSCWRRPMLALSCAAAVLLSACGGGGYVDSAGNFNIGVTLAGTYVGQTSVYPGGAMGVSVRAGQSVVFDAGEPAVWTLYVGGSAVRGGAQVYYAGVDLRATPYGSSNIAVDTYAAYRLGAPVQVTLVATSTWDAAQVATIHLTITN